MLSFLHKSRAPIHCKQGLTGSFWPRGQVQHGGPWCSDLASSHSPSSLPPPDPHPRLKLCSKYSLLTRLVGLDSACWTDSGFPNWVAEGGGARAAWLGLAGGVEPPVGDVASLCSDMAYTIHAGGAAYTLSSSYTR